MKTWIYHFRNRLPIIYQMLFIPIIFAITLQVMADMPPEHYSEKAKQSKIKAIAIVKNIETLDIGTHHSTKKATFKLEYALSKDTPKIVTGYFKSVETAKQRKNIIAGGEIYFYPHPGQRVYVTTYQDGGNITTMTPVTPELEKGIIETPDKISYVMGKAHIQGSQKNLIQNEPLALIEEKRIGKDPIHNAGIPGLDMLVKDIKPLEMNGQDVHGTPEEEMQGQLLMALGNDDVVEVHQVLKNGAKINQAFSRSGQTPLMAAESFVMVKLLCENGADTSKKNNGEDTAKDIAYDLGRQVYIPDVGLAWPYLCTINVQSQMNLIPIYRYISIFIKYEKEPKMGSIYKHVFAPLRIREVDFKNHIGMDASYDKIAIPAIAPSSVITNNVVGDATEVGTVGPAIMSAFKAVAYI